MTPIEQNNIRIADKVRLVIYFFIICTSFIYKTIGNGKMGHKILKPRPLERERWQFAEPTERE